jgi:deoxyribodipyrimidine photo-lyase
MYSVFIFRRDLRLFDNTTLIQADKEATKNNTKILPIFIFDPHQIQDKNKSDNCVQFMVESLKDLNNQLKEYGSKLYTLYGKPWEVIDDLIKHYDIHSVSFNTDYTVYSKERDNKIMKVCQRNNVDFMTQEDCMLNNIDTIKTTTNKFYEKFTPYYDNAKENKIREPQKHNYKNLIKSKLTIKTFQKMDKLYENNPDIYMHGGRDNGIKILRNIKKLKDYNENRNFPEFDTTLLSPHNKFGTVSIREVYHTIKRNLGTKSELLKQLYWRDFYYNQMYFKEEYFHLNNGRYAKLKWDNNMSYFKKWKAGETGIPIVDAGMKQLNKTGWIHNRIRMLVATTLTKILLIDWRLGESYFKKKLIDYDVSQNIMNWYWISGEAPFANPYFRVLNPEIQTKKNDKDCNYTKKWIKDIDDCSKQEAIVDVPKMIKKSIQMYK